MLTQSLCVWFLDSELGIRGRPRDHPRRTSADAANDELCLIHNHIERINSQYGTARKISKGGMWTRTRMWDRLAACLNPASDTRVAIRLGEIFTSEPGA